jgi:hypothetical protein
MHKAQVSIEAGQTGTEIGIEIDSVQFYAAVRLDTNFDFDFKPDIFMRTLNRRPACEYCC